MTGKEWYQKHKGESILIPAGGKGNNGQCAQAADSYMKEVFGLPYIYTPAALDWWTKAPALGLTENFNKIPAGQPVLAGDYVIYDQRVGAREGHIDMASRDGTVKDFWAYDSNWGGDAFKKNGYPVLHEVHHNDAYNNYIVGYLRRKDKMYKGHDAKYWYDAYTKVVAQRATYRNRLVKVLNQITGLVKTRGK